MEYEFEIDDWNRLLLPELQRELDSKRRMISSFLWTDSPVSVVSSELYRKRTLGELVDAGPTAPVDRFVFAKGEPAERMVTKVGGLPYRPESLPWPRDDAGTPMVFLAQFCFGQSNDLLTDLPGAVLLVFIRAMRGFLTGNWVVDPCDREEAIYTEWHPDSLTELVSEGEVPDTPILVPRCQTLRFRSVDYLDDSELIATARRHIEPILLPENKALADAAMCAIFKHSGMKIGGVPYRHAVKRQQDGARFIASFGGVGPVSEFPYPWANRAAPLSAFELYRSEDCFEIRNGACIDFFVDANGKTFWDGEFL
jgi:hypothetical protein